MKHLTEEAAIKAAQETHGGDIIDFDGQNCNDYLEDDADECPGWEPTLEQSRCVCGNRRVYWATYGDPEQGYTAFAVAN